MTRATEGQRLFRRDGDCKRYLTLLQQVVERHGWQVMTFALMTTHSHLLVITTTDALSDGLWWLNWHYAEDYKARYAPRCGHVLGGRARTKPVKDDRYFLAVVRYIAHNPVGVFCDRPQDYRWSADRALRGAAPGVPLLARNDLWGWFGAEDGAGDYAAFVDGRLPDRYGDVRSWAEGPPAERPALHDLVTDRTPHALWTAHRRWAYSMRAISRATGLSYTAVRAAIATADREPEPEHAYVGSSAPEPSSTISSRPSATR